MNNAVEIISSMNAEQNNPNYRVKDHLTGRIDTLQVMLNGLAVKRNKEQVSPFLDDCMCFLLETSYLLEDIVGINDDLINTLKRRFELLEALFQGVAVGEYDGTVSRHLPVVEEFLLTTQTAIENYLTINDDDELFGS
jgi:hypothetical protein